MISRYAEQTIISNSLDANKTADTHIVTAEAAAHLERIGCKPIETEVFCYNWGIADLASFVFPSDTEESIIGLSTRGHRLLTVLCEVKTTRADFKKDVERKFNQPDLPANLCYLAYPKGMLAVEEIPKRWIGIEVNIDKRCIYRIRRNQWNREINSAISIQKDVFVAQVAIRRAHRTRYRELKDWFRAHRAQRQAKEKTWRAEQLIQGVIQYITQEQCWQKELCKTIEDVYEHYGFKPTGFSEQTNETIERLRKAAAASIANGEVLCG